jgi:hypothetical protein
MRRAPLFVFLLLVQILPTLPFYLGLSKSMALGTTLAASLFIFIYWVHGAVWNRLPLSYSIEFLVRPVGWLLVIITFILLHATVAVRLLPIDLERLGQTLPPLAFLIVGGATMGLLMVRSSDREVDAAVKISFWFLCSLIAMRLIGVEPAVGALAKPMFPYTEVSHFALAFSPVLMFRTARARDSRKLAWIVFGVAIGFVLQSLSLLACCLLIAYVSRRLAWVAGVGLIVAAAGLPLELSYFSSRLDFSSDSRNLSALVYIQGWEQILESLRWSSGWGLGFEQLGFRDTESIAGSVIRSLTGGTDSNLRDGSFVLVKLVSEFGIFALLFVGALVVTMYRCARRLRGGDLDSTGTLIRCIIVAYAIDMFIRGPGYFCESGLLFVAAVAALRLERNPAAHSVASAARTVSGTLTGPSSA